MSEESEHPILRVADTPDGIRPSQLRKAKREINRGFKKFMEKRGLTYDPNDFFQRRGRPKNGQPGSSGDTDENDEGAD